MLQGKLITLVFGLKANLIVQKGTILMAVPQTVQDALANLQTQQDTLSQDQSASSAADQAQAAADAAAAHAASVVVTDQSNLGQSVANFIALVTQTYGQPAPVAPVAPPVTPSV